MQVIKRNGNKVEFNRKKIIDAIMKAAAAAEVEIYDFAFVAGQIAEDVIKCYQDLGVNEMSVEDIQDLVEVDLYEIAGQPAVAKEYITYRYKRNAARDYETSLFKELDEKYRASNVQNQNANVDEYSFGGRKGEADSVVAKKMAIDYMLSDKAKFNHTHNRIYIHDLDNYVVGCHNCLTVPFDDLLKNGFNTRQTDIRPAGSVNTAFQLVAVIFQLQSLQQFGGVSASHLDWTMVPYVRKSFYKHFKDGLIYVSRRPESDIKEYFSAFDVDTTSITNKETYSDEMAYNYAMDMTIKEVHQAVEGMYHNLNTLQSRSGNQLPFTSINYGTCTLEEGRMVIKAILEVSIEGLGALHKTPIFPCGIMVMKKDINLYPGTPNYDLYQLALQSTARRLYPNYANGDEPMQVGWVQYDREQKMKVINSLSTQQQEELIALIEANPALGQMLDLEVVE